MKRSHLIAALCVAALLCIAGSSRSLAQCPPGSSLITGFGQSFGGMSCVIEITYCYLPGNPTIVYVQSYRSLGGSCSAPDVCDAVRQTIANWLYGECPPPGNPPKAPHTFRVTFCGKTCDYTLSCNGLSEYPVVTPGPCN